MRNRPGALLEHATDVAEAATSSGSRSKADDSAAPGYATPQAPYAPNPPRVDAVTAALRYPLLVVLPMLLLGVLGGILGARKPTTYTAESQVLVGQPSPGTAGQLPGIVQAEQSLAGIYAREIDFDAVVVPIARRFHATPASIAASLSATPDPQSPIVRVFATAGSAARSIALANAAGAKFAAYITSLTQSSDPSDHVLNSYTQAATAYAQAKDKEQQLALTSRAPNSALVQADVAMQIAQLNESTLAAQYQSLVGTQQNTPALSLFEAAATATSNRKSNLELYVFGGVIAGLVLGAALATLVANRELVRNARAA